MKYKIVFDCPDDQKLIDRLIDVAAEAGAGRYRNYSRAALVVRGYATWKSMKGANPHIGKVGAISRVKSARIEMICDGARLERACAALRKAHPYEEPSIEAIRLEGV